VYVRQSSPRQVEEHRESADLQYGLTRRAEQYGWSKDRILVIDDDQGQSGRTAEGRLGFQRLIAEVSLDHVGLVLGIEMSRLARSNKDWHQLLELCALFRCLLADQDGLYDPSNYNDRLLLGLKGTMSEAELHILRGRMYQGSLNKARRGELITHAPLGYLRTPNGEIGIDPDRQIQDAVKLVFEKFDELGSAMSLLRYLRQHDIRLPVRPIYGPTYAGSYAHGRFQTDPRRRTTGKDQGRFRAEMDEWKVLIHGKLPAYITWDQYVANVNRLRDNSSQFDTVGAVRDSESLLAGIIFCGRCGKRTFPHYKGKTKPAAYVCPGDYSSGGSAKCQRISARFVDDLIAAQVLAAMEPASLELSLQATGELQEERNHIRRQWQRRLQSASSHADRVRRQYDAADPSNRLVASKLERQWEDALGEQRRLKEEHDRYLRDQPENFSPDDIEAVRKLAADIPFLWQESPRFSTDHKQIVRYLIGRVVIEVHSASEVVAVTIHWQGGFESQHELIRSVARYEQLRSFPQLRDRIDQLWRSGRSTTAIAESLNSEGFHTTTSGNGYTRHTVRKLLDSWGLTRLQRGQISAEIAKLDTNEWWLVDLSRKLEVDRTTLARWCRRGWVNARQLPGQRRWWIIWADEDECNRLQQLFRHGRGYPRHNGSPYPAVLKTPKQKLAD
jgi:DNA invertase Pin-like site-specific DNA recombinase